MIIVILCMLIIASFFFGHYLGFELGKDTQQMIQIKQREKSILESKLRILESKIND